MYESKIEHFLDSREVAEMVGKQHKNLLADVRNYVTELNELKIQPVDFFREVTYKDTKGQERPCYSITKKGCEFIAHKLTGIKGTEFTAKYITRFHEMEETLACEIDQNKFLQQNPEFKRTYEIFDTIIMDFFRCMEKALQEKRYYLLPRTNGAEYCKPDPETLGLFDYQYYYIYNRRTTSLFDEIHPEIPMRAVWNLLSLLGITENYSRKQVGSVITFMGRKAYAVRLIRSKCPIKLTTYGENRYLLVEKRYVEEDEYKALMLSSTDKNSEERS